MKSSANRAIGILGGNAGLRICHPNDHVTLGQSTTMFFSHGDAAGRIVPYLMKYLIPAMLEQSFARTGKAFDHILKSGRTHMMDAVPIRLGQEFLGRRHGDAALWGGFGAGPNLARRSRAGGLSGRTESIHIQISKKLVVKHLSRFVAGTLKPAGDLRYNNAIHLAMSVVPRAAQPRVELIRITNDLRRSPAVQTLAPEIALPALQPGSSIMPGKVTRLMAN